MTVCDFLLETSARHPTRIAFRLVDQANPNGPQGSAITYEELATRSRRLAARLRQAGLNERAVLLYPAGIDFIVAMFACFFAKVIAVPIRIPKSVRCDAFRKIMDDSKPRFILSSDSLRQKLDKENAFPNEHPACEWMIFESGLGDTPEQEIALPRPELKDIAYLQYTSGSTSSPRGVIVSHGNVIANCASIAKKWRMGENSVGVSWLPHFHDMGLITGILLPIVSGCTSVLLPPAIIATPLLWLKAIERFGGTHSHAPNFAFQACVDKVSPEEIATLDLSCWQVAGCAAEPIRESTVKHFLERFAPARFGPNALHPGYGLSEATLVVTDVAVDQQLRSRRLDVSSLAEGFAKNTSDPAGIAVVSCGCPIQDSEVAIINPKTFLACPDNTIGEIWVHGPSVAAGYWNERERTQETFHGTSPDYPERSFLRTGDLGFRDRGEIFISGRLKDLIIIRGRNIYPNDIEELAQSSHDAVRSMGAAAFAVRENDGEQLVIVQEVRRVKRHHLGGVIDAIRQRITSDMDVTPLSIVLVNEFSIPRTTSGKIRRKFCQEQYLAGNLSALDSWTLPERVLPATTPPASVPMESRASISVLEIVARRTGFPPNTINREKSFADYGFDSSAAVEAAADLSRLLGQKLESSLLYDQPTVAKLISYLETLESTEKLERNGATRPNGCAHPANLSPSRLEGEPGAKQIAIVGIGCRFPAANGPQQFWNLLQDGRSAIGEYPTDRPQVAGSSVSFRGGFLDGIDAFDARFFGISPVEASLMDPQQRLLMEVTLHALEDAGLTRAATRGKRVGVFIGVSNSDYGQNSLRADAVQESYTVSGTALSIAANRLSYAFDWTGPSVSVDTACSSSLIAVHQAIRSLRAGESDFAVVGGANIILSPAVYRDFQSSGLLSPDGLCKAFDKRADGYVRSEGIGVVVLRRLAEAERNNDRIYAVLLGSAINHNGRSNGLLAPKAEGQRALLHSAWKEAGILPANLSYIEAHGTGTSLGDAIELRAIDAALKDSGGSARCRVGSVKSNIGHAESAAGIAGLIKTALALHHELIPATLHFQALSEELSAAELSVLIADKPEPWPGNEERIAGVSSLGFGGSNAHIVIAGHKKFGVQTYEAPPAGEKLHILPISAGSPEALYQLIEEYDQLLSALPVTAFGRLCTNLALRRDHYLKRIAIVAQSPSEAREALKKAAFAKGQDTPLRRPFVFVFSGQGSYRDGLGAELLRQPAFRRVMDACTSVLHEAGLPSAADILAGLNCEGFDQRYDGQQLRIFLFQIGLCALLYSWGIKPDALIGHSLGEITAAHLAGALSLDDSIKLILLRSEISKLISGQGTLLAIRMPAEQCRELISETGSPIGIAIQNGPKNVVVSGTLEDIDAFNAVLESRRIPSQRVRINFAAHSSALDPYKERFLQCASTLTNRRATLPVYSSTLGAAIADGILSADHWWRNFRNPVCFSSAIESMFRDGFFDFLEVSGHPLLLASIKDVSSNRFKLGLYSTCDQGYQEEHSLLLSLSKLYSKGAAINWENFYDQSDRFAGFPLYPFQREAFWCKPGKAAEVVGPAQSPQRNGVLVNGTQIKGALSVQAVTAEIREIVARNLQQQIDLIDLEAPFLDLGADSIVMIKVLRAIERRFKVPLSIKQVFEKQRTVSALAEFVHGNLDQQLQLDHQPQLESVNCASQSNEPEQFAIANAPVSPLLERIMLEQLATVSRIANEQTQMLRSVLLQSPLKSNDDVAVAVLAAAPGEKLSSSNGHHGTNGSYTANGNHESKGDHTSNGHHAGNGNHKPLSPPAARKSERFVPYQAFDIRSAKPVAGMEMLGESLRNRLEQKTQASKTITQNNRRILADNRASAGFRMSTKELLYPIHAERAQGAYIYDCDGNKYVDLTMGFGTNLFGHNPDFIKQALAEQLEKGFAIGPQTPMAGEVARLITEFTDMERVAFCNSGTEAVMTALRLVRTATGRRKIVIFEESYHGTFDGVLGDHNDGEPSAIPLAPGILPGFIEGLYILSYDDRQSISFIEEHASEIAGVLLEPVRSRRPDCQSREFLAELRQVTARASIALIFDEVITGFRMAPGGAQEWFGVRADIATYGKVVGGGMPIGVVAGNASLLDAIDGGYWRYADQSYPAATTTFFAGTFCKHPLTMAASRAALLHMRAEGAGLQKTLNQRTADLAARLNRLFQGHETSFEVVHFGSLFRFRGKGNCDPIFYHLLDRGVYVWEGRNCFLSTAHTQADIDLVVDAVDDLLKETQKGRLVPRLSKQEPGFEDAAREQHPAPSDIPLETAQRATWAWSQVDESVASANTVAVVAQLLGRLDLDLFGNAVTAAAFEYDALRMSVAANGQHALLGAPPALVVDTVESRSAVEVQQQTEAWIREKATAVFELSQSPTSAISLLKTGPTSHVLVIAAHHIFCDGTSLGLVLEGILRRYNSRDKNQDNEPVQQTFSSFLQLQEERANEQSNGMDQRFWQQELARPTSPVNVIGAAPRPHQKTFVAERLRRELPSELVCDVLQLSRSRGCTPFVVFLTAWRSAINAISGSFEFRIACPVSTRSEANESLVGYFQNLLPIRVSITAGHTILQDLQQTRAVALECLSHSEYPFSDMCQLARGPRTEDRFPLADIGFNYEKYPRAFSSGDLKIDIRMTPISGALLDLTLNISNVGERHIADLDFNTDIYSRSLAAKCLDAFEAALGRMKTELSGNSHPASHEAADVQEELTSETAPFASVGVEQQARKMPEAIACRYGREELSYGQLNSKANQLGHYLQELGVGPEALVGICLQRGNAMVCSLLAVLKAGGAYLPLDPEYPVERLHYMVKDSGLRVVLTHRELQHLFVGTPTQVICLEDEQHWAYLQATSLSSQVGPDNLAYVIYTSGSTGEPKGVMLTQAGLANLIAEQTRVFDVRPGTRVLQVASSSFDASASEIWVTLVGGGQLELASSDELRPGQPLLTLLQDRQIELVTLTPTALSLVREGPLPHLRTLVVAGEACSAELAERWRQGRHLINAYGPTEATVCATAGLVDTPGTPALGSALGQVQVYVLDEHLDPVPAGTSGELYIGGSGVARGYLNRPGLTAERFLPDPIHPGRRLYRTGDLVRSADQGQLHFLGRSDHQIKLHGIRLEPAEIESVLRSAPGVADAVVLLRTDLGDDPRLLAYITTVPGVQQPSVEQLRSHAHNLLPAHMLPNTFTFLPAFPTTPNGKLDRSALPEPPASRPKLDQPYVPPRTPEEISLAHLWSEILRVEPIGIHDNFFELGGDSILALQIVAHAAESAIKITPKQIFSKKTIANLLSSEDKSKPQGKVERRVDCAAEASRSLTPIQHWFFNQHFEEISRWNHALLLRAPGQSKPEVFAEVTRALAQQHPVLRTAFVQLADGGWSQSPAREYADAMFLSIDLSELDEPALLARVDTMLDALNGEFNLPRGYVFRVVFFQHRTSPLVLLVAHHLVVDGVSWRILLEDLRCLYSKVSEHKSVDLPEPGASLTAWAKHLEAYACSRSMRTNWDFWQKQLPLTSSGILPLDHPSAENLEEFGETVQFTLSPGQTRILALDLPKTLQVDALSIFISAIAAAWNTWTASPTLTLAMESSGRTSPTSHEFDLTRSIGWFTSLFPVSVQIPVLSHTADRSHFIKTIDGQESEVIANGMEYGIHKYLRSCASDTNQPEPDINFNYLGSFDSGPLGRSGGFELISTPTRGTRNPQNRRPHLLEIEALIKDGALAFSIGYSRAQFRKETIEALLSLLKNFLLETINQLPRQSVQPTSSFLQPPVTSVATNHRAINTLATDRESFVRPVDCPLTPLQRGMLGDLLLAKPDGAYIQQLSCHFGAGLDVPRFTSIWQAMIRELEILRLKISGPKSAPKATIETGHVQLFYEQQDWCSVDAADQEKLWARLLHDDRAKGFALSNPPLMRLHFVKTRPQAYRMLWTFHHLILDGWSAGLLLDRVSQAYAQKLEAVSAQTSSPSPRKFAAWLHEQSSSTSEDFWRTYFSGHQWQSNFLPSATSGTVPAKTPSMAEYQIRLVTSLHKRLMDVSRKANVTLYTLLQGAWALTLGSLSKKDDVVFGAVVSGRSCDFPGIQELIGMCANTVMVRVMLPDQNLTDWFADLQMMNMTVRMYEQTPLGKVRIWSGAPARKQLFDSVFVFENYPIKRCLESLKPLGVTYLRAEEQTDLPFSVVVEPGNPFLIRFVYDLHRWSRQETAFVASVMQTILENIVANPTASVLNCAMAVDQMPQEALAQGD